MKYFSIILTVMVTALIGRSTEPQTGWFYDQSTFQAFYMLQNLTIDGEVVVGDGSGAPPNDNDCYTSGTCDVIGAFIDRNDGAGEICVGWVYGGILNGAMTVPLMGSDGAEGTANYLQPEINAGGTTYPAESAYLRVYDASYGSYLDVNPGDALPGWSNNGIFNIAGTSTACNGGDEVDDCGVCSGSFGGHEANSDKDCTGDCFGSTEIDCFGVCDGSAALDDCGVCEGENADMDCDNECFGSSVDTWCDGLCGETGPIDDGCDVCGGDNSSCTGCTNTDSDDYVSGNTIPCNNGTENDCCTYTVPGATGLTATPGSNRISLAWNAPSDNFTQSDAGYTYHIYQDGAEVANTTYDFAQILGLSSDTYYCFTILAEHGDYGYTADSSDEACATPEEATGAPTWRMQLKAEIDSYDQFQFSGNEDWLLHDNQNFLGVAPDATYGYDSGHDAPDPPQGPGNYIKLFFDHPEWEIWVTHFTEDIVLEDDNFFSANLTQWNVRVQSDVPGSTVIRFKTDIGTIPANYELYVELDGEYTRLAHGEEEYTDTNENGQWDEEEEYTDTNENGQWDDGETKIEFYMDGSGQQDLAVYIGNIAPQAPDNLTSTGNYNTINLNWDSDGDDLNNIGNRYPATSYNVYRDDEPANYNDNLTDYAPSDGEGGCGGLLTGTSGQTNTDYFDNANLYPEWDSTDLEGGELLLQESTYSHTVTGSNAAGESSRGHTVRLSGGGDTWNDGRGSTTSATTGPNADPESVPVYMDSPNGTNLDAGLYEIPHNNSPDANRIVIPIGAWGTNDQDFPYANLQYFDYEWTEVDGPFDDITEVVGLTAAQLSFKTANSHEDSEGNHNGDKSYIWNLRADAQHPVRVQAGPKTNNMTGLEYFSGCSAGDDDGWTTAMHLHSDNADITVTIQPEPNSNPIAADARDLSRFGDGASVVTSDQYDNDGGFGGNDFNDYEDDANINGAQFGVWYEPHDNNIVHETANGIINYFADNADFGNNSADLYFTAINSDDDDGMCDGSILVCADFGDAGEFVDDCSLDGDCCPAAWIGDGWADCADQTAGCDLTCYENDGGDCDENANSCPESPTGEQYIEDCSGDGDCAPADWVGDGYCDGVDQEWGYDLTCYDNDGGDCDRSADDGRTPNRDAWWMPDTERYTEMISSNSRAASTFCDEQSYVWFYTKASAAAFNYLDLNANNIYDIGERFSLIDNNAIVQEFGPEEFWDDNESGFWDAGEGFVDENENTIFDVGTDLGSYLPPTKVQYDACGNCTPGSFTASDDSEEVGHYGHGQVDLHAEFQDNVYILTLEVTDAYGDIDNRSLLFVVKDERNSAPVANEHRSQPTAGDAYYVRYEENVRDVSVRDNADCSDNLGAVDTDNDDLTYEWTYSGEGSSSDLSEFNSVYAHSNGFIPDGWLDASADLVVGNHTFTFTVTDSYNAASSESTTFEIREEPLAVPATVIVDSTDLKYTIISVKDNSLADFEYDDCNGEVYNGAHFNTDKIELYNGGTLINTWMDNDTEQTDFDVHIDKNLEAETYYEYTAIAYNSNDDIEQSASSSTSTTTHDRPQITVLTPNGAEIRSIGDNFDVDFSTTQKEYISKIEVFYLPNGLTGDADDDDIDDGEVPGENSDGVPVGSETGVHVNGDASGDDTENFRISDNPGTEINYNAKVVVRVHDVGDYDGGNVQYHDDISDYPFTMAAHLLTKDYAAGWHLLGPPLVPANNDLVSNFAGSLGNWGSEWVAYDVTGTYDLLSLNLGEGYYLALAGDKTLVQEGNPVIADEDCADCSDDNFDLGDLSLDRGWNLIANPLVNKVSKYTFMINDSSGVGDLDFEDAVDAGWIAPTIYGWFENSYVSIERIMPFDGYWINTSRDLTIKVRPHLFENGELTRKADDLVTSVLELRARDISGEGISDFITVGLSENADNKFVYGEDEYDLPRQAYASMGGEFIDMKVSSNLMKDMKSAEYDDYQAWTISIESEKVDNDIELSWGDVSAFEDDLHIVVNGEAINMHEENYIELTSMIEEVAIVVGNVDSYLNPIPEEFGLSAAYPNPFNPTTNLGLALNADGFVSMSVFNIRGQVVEVLVDRNMKAGYHNITWNADGISSGMYFVRVETGANTAMQKLMLLK